MSHGDREMNNKTLRKSRVAGFFSVMLIAVLLLGQVAFAAEETVVKSEIHGVGGSEGFCFFTEKEAKLQESQVARMTDLELTIVLLKETGLYAKTVQCSDVNHEKKTSETFMEEIGKIEILEADLAKIRAAAPAAGEEVTVYADIQATFNGETYATDKDGTGRGHDGVNDAADAPKGLLVVTIVGQEPPKDDENKDDENKDDGKDGDKDSGKGAGVTPTDPKDPSTGAKDPVDGAAASTDDGEAFFDDGDMEAIAGEAGGATEGSATLPEYRTIKTVAKKSEPVEEALIDGEPVSLTWEAPAITDDEETVAPARSVDGLGLGILAAALIVALLFALSIRSDLSVLRWFEQKKAAFEAR